MTKTQKITTALAVLVLSTGMTLTTNAYYWENGKEENITDGRTFSGEEFAVDSGAKVIVTGGAIEVANDRLTTEGGTIELNGTKVTSGIWASRNYNQGGKFKMTGGELSGNTIAVQGYDSEVSITNGTVKVNDIIVRDAILIDGNWQPSNNAGGTIRFNNTNATANTLTLTKSGMILDNASKLNLAGDANLEGSTLEVNSGSEVNVNGKANVSKDSKVTVDGSTLTFKSGSELHVTSSVSGASTFAVGDQPLHVTNNGKIVFAAGSAAYTTADDSNKIGTVATADNSGTVEVDKKAALYVTNAKTDGQTTYNASEIVIKDGQGATWDGQIFAGNQRSSFDTATGTFSKSSSFADTYKGLFAAKAIQAAADEGKGTGFDFTEAVEKAYQTSDAAADNSNITKAFNSAAGLTGLAGVGYGMYSFTNAFNDTVREHKVGTESLWATYLHDKRTADGLKVGNLDTDYDLSYNGFVLGSDFYNNGKVQVGAAFAYANGDVSTNGGLASTKNDVDYYGGTVYGVLDGGNGLTYKAELGYGKSSNDLTQYNSGTKITGKTDATAFHVGVSAEKEIKTGADTWTPFAGLYFIDLGIDDYTDSLGFKHDSDNASAWTLPLGVSYRHEVTSGDWTYAPVVTLGYRFAFGDKDIDETYSYNGVGDTFGTDIAESVFFGRLGFEAAKDNVSFGVHYGYEKGSDTKSNQWGVNLAYHF